MSTRAKLERSFEGDCRHLFRHLREPGQLRRNPLVRAYFPQDLTGVAKVRADATVASTIREAVHRWADYCLQNDRLADEEVALRRHAIITDGDLGGARRHDLAAKLGISARQFTRLQQEIRIRVAILVISDLKREGRSGANIIVQTPTPLTDAAAVAVRQSPLRAISRLSTIAKGSGDPHLITLALCLEGLIRQRYLGDSIGATKALTASRVSLERIAVTDPERALIEAQVELASAENDLESGHRYDRAVAACINVALSLEQIDGFAGFLRLRAFSLAAYGSFVMGHRDQSLRLLRSFRSEVGILAKASVQERVELLLWSALTLAEHGGFLEASRMLADASLIARQQDLKLDLIRLDLLYAAIALGFGAPAAPERLAKICEQSEKLSSTSLRAQAYTYLVKAQMRVAQHKPEEILITSQRVLHLSASGTELWIEAKAAESFARVLSGDIQGADRAARGADEAAAASRNAAARGTTLRELARVAHVQGHKRDASRMVMAAIESGYSVGKPLQTAQALELAAEILCRPNYRYEAAALRSALSLQGSHWFF